MAKRNKDNINKRERERDFGLCGRKVTLNERDGGGGGGGGISALES